MSNPTAPAMTICLPDLLPPEQQFLPGIRRAPDRGFRLTRCLMPVLPMCLKMVWMPRTDLSIPPNFENIMGPIFDYGYGPFR
ncbi:hypothetical protein [Desulfobacter postgatei]|uniref:hypothetical protein n=1 Tax=Desulfobacter postgatei TaxID=2293 RepID=UPI00259BBC41|nr:hypothetical protein [uncultured Desulfobacter sp.]